MWEEVCSLSMFKHCRCNCMWSHLSIWGSVHGYHCNSDQQELQVSPAKRLALEAIVLHGEASFTRLITSSHIAQPYNLSSPLIGLSEHPYQVNAEQFLSWPWSGKSDHADHHYCSCSNHKSTVSMTYQMTLLLPAAWENPLCRLMCSFFQAHHVFKATYTISDVDWLWFPCTDT